MRMTLIAVLFVLMAGAAMAQGTPTYMPECSAGGIPYVETGEHGAYTNGCIVDGKKQPHVIVLGAAALAPGSVGVATPDCFWRTGRHGPYPPPEPECIGK